MFATRLKIVMAVFGLLLAVLMARAVQVQYFDHEQWIKEARRGGEDVEEQEAIRGRILDYKGRELAVDSACIDAVLDYRVLQQPPDDKWVKDYARLRLLNRLGSSYEQAPAGQRRQLLDEQILQVKADIEAMWKRLGDVSLTGYSFEQIEERRQQIIRRVQMLKRYRWYANYVEAEKQAEQKEPAWWAKWIAGEEQDQQIDLDRYAVEMAEEKEPHVILPAITPELANILGKELERLPGLTLRQGEHRAYPLGQIACHVVGYLRQAGGDDIKNDPNRQDKLRRYRPSEEIGKSGVEQMAEQSLRGTRGRIRIDRASGKVIESTPAQPGQDVQLSIDSILHQKIENAFQNYRDKDTGQSHPVYGAAVLIDVQTSEVRALVSYPTYDLNSIDRLLGKLTLDDINMPMLNRATMSAREPGSTVKPMVGLAGVSEGVVGVHEGIECTGYLVINGLTQKQHFRCWTVETGKHVGLTGHHLIPTNAPHRGIDGNRDGFLEFSDALERSCNVWCETVANRLGVVRLSDWYKRFGLGQKTGIGLPERIGKLPDEFNGPERNRSATLWQGGIGQGYIAATPIQMANVAATIARNGNWRTPHLLTGSQAATTQPLREDEHLPISAEAIAAAQRGMWLSVNGPAGTGKPLHYDKMDVAGKTGTAQVGKLSVPVRDEQGRIVKKDGKEVRRVIEPSTTDQVNPEAPWYRAENGHLTHAWFIGFAPAAKPQMAFAVMVEYGGGGGKVAGAIARSMLDAAMQEGYLSVR